MIATVGSRCYVAADQTPKVDGYMNNFEKIAMACREYGIPRPQRTHNPTVVKAYERLHPRVCSYPGCEKVHDPHDKSKYIELDHKDNNHHNNSFTNLQWLCREHHMAKHDKISWLDLNYSNIKRTDTPEQIKQQLLIDNADSISYSKIVAMNTKHVRQAIANRLGWKKSDGDSSRQTFGGSQPTSAKSSGKYETIMVNGIKIKCKPGSSVEFL